ncbi:MAG TPA: sulfotransferase [Rhodanobacteraceae bacterium]|nr:sulfotransferase [Rhodanobacteraceae bacterium]
MSASPRLGGLSPPAIQRVVLSAQALDRGQVDEAVRQLAPVLADHPSQPEVLRLHAGALSMRGRHQDAIEAMQRALAQRPDDALYYNTLGTILSAADYLDDAVAAMRHACELQPDLAMAWFNLGVMLTHCVRHEEAIDALQRAVRINPKHAEARALLSDMLRTQGRLAEASEQYRQILAERPAAGMAWWGLADIKTLRFDERDIERMRQALRTPGLGLDDLVPTGFALAKALDDHGRYAESLDVLAQSNALARQRQRWNASEFSAGVSAMLKAFSNPVAPAPDPALGSEILFIISLPRSGSTLVEQILASHSRVEGAGELSDLPLTLTGESQRRKVPFPLWAGQASSADWQRLGRRYLDRTARWRAARPMSIDKLPSNWMYIGAIRSMLPGARIIACRRDPLETCFSCYRQFLAGNDYARTFEDLAAFWHDFDRSVRFWRERAPGNLYEHSYERLVAEPEPAIRALLDFCRLPFEEACLNFHENRREVRSPSATQVRQPLRRDTAHTTRYGGLLDPLRKALGYPPFAG